MHRKILGSVLNWESSPPPTSLWNSDAFLDVVFWWGVVTVVSLWCHLCVLYVMVNFCQAKSPQLQKLHRHTCAALSSCTAAPEDLSSSVFRASSFIAPHWPCQYLQGGGRGSCNLSVNANSILAKVICKSTSPPECHIYSFPFYLCAHHCRDLIVHWSSHITASSIDVVLWPRRRTT